MVAAGTKYFQHVTDYHVTMSHGENKLTPKETQNSCIIMVHCLSFHQCIGYIRKMFYALAYSTYVTTTHVREQIYEKLCDYYRCYSCTLFTHPRISSSSSYPLCYPEQYSVPPEHGCCLTFTPARPKVISASSLSA